jgi:hypothetical protein
MRYVGWRKRARGGESIMGQLEVKDIWVNWTRTMKKRNARGDGKWRYAETHLLSIWTVMAVELGRGIGFWSREMEMGDAVKAMISSWIFMVRPYSEEETNGRYGVPLVVKRRWWSLQAD